jgi:hypothetical protein
LFAVTSLALLAAGCGREEIRVYRAPKRTEDPATAQTQAASTATAGSRSGVHWEAPANWTEQPATQMRVGSFGIKGANGGAADVSVIPLSGDSGTELGNVNRWRGQMGLSPVAEAELPALGAAVEIGDQSATLYDFLGTPANKSVPERMLVAVANESGTAWFFKMMGDDGTVAGERVAFVAFLKSVHFHADGAAASHEAAPAAPAAAAPEASAKWKIPASWTETAPGAMQQAKFLAKGDGAAEAEITLSVFPGQAGGLLPNVNRWRKQIQLQPVTEDELEKLVQTQDVPTGKMTVLDMSDANGGNRLVAAIVVRSGQSWYFKIKGDSGIIDRERAAFLQFAGQPQ